MDSGNDPIKALLETTGLTCDDLLKKLLQYKNQQNKPTEEQDNVDNSKNNAAIESDNHVDTTSGPLYEPDSEEATASVSGEKKVQEDLDSVDSFVNKNGKDKENTVAISSHDVTEKNVESNSSLEVFQKKSSGVSLNVESTATQDNFTSGPEIPHEEEKESTEDTISINTLNKIEIPRRKSISEELVRKLSNRLGSTTQPEISDDDTKNDEDELQNSDNFQENDIEVCQLPDAEVLPPKPLLKLRSDLFENNSRGNFTISDNEDEENDPEIKEFLKNVEVVTSEVKDGVKHSSVPTAIRSDTSRMRRVKMGFVKKRILCKAIKCLNVGHKRNEQSRMLVSALEKPNHDPKFTIEGVSEEEIRANLKLQLCSLRNRKKTRDLLNGKHNTNNLKITYEKKKPLEVCQISSTTNDKDISQNILEDNPSQTKNNDTLFSQSTDTDFMIVDVQGGVEFPDIQEQECVKNPLDTPTDVIRLTKTKDVTKIKGWKNKKFQLDDEIISNKEYPLSEETTLSNKETVQRKEIISSKETVQCKITDKSNESTQISKEGVVQGEKINDKEDKQCEKIQPENGKDQELAPFVSNSLEEFLTENSTLNISYYIPKLGAEEAINTEKYNTVLIPKTATSEATKREDEENVDKPKVIKPKTLAEKRRMLEGNKKKFLSMETFNKSSFIIYNGNKLYVPTMHSEKCLGKIKFTLNSHKKAVSNSNKEKKENSKLTLLDEYHRNQIPVTYKPGPLRKKTRLQNLESTTEWSTEVRKLPTVKLKIIPEIGKPVPPSLIHLFDFGTKVDGGRLEFALSAIVTKKQENKQGFTLTVPYANKQKCVLVRKRKHDTPCSNYYIPPEKNTVKSVLDDIVSYVEHKENEKTIIREAEKYVEDLKTERIKPPTINEASSVRKSKRRRLDTELMRLSCKVVSVSVDETEEAESTCQKSFCRLGCLCKSLICIPRIPVHCSKLECMFECNCSKSQDISLEGGALSCDAVTRLEDQAKRNLAKVEKEFTQTVIHTNDQTILIPSSDRNKSKRTKRIPKRFSDYLDNFESVQKETSVVEEEKEEVIQKCVVKLQKLDFRGIIPLCLYHNCYNCSCMFQDGKRSNPSQNGKRSNPSSDVEDSGQSKAKKKKLSVEKKVPKVAKEMDEINFSIEPHRITTSNNDSDSDYMDELKIADSRRTKYKGGCARAFGVHPEVLARNEIPFYRKKLRHKVAQAEYTINFDPLPLSYSDYTEPNSDEIDVTSPINILAVDRLKMIIVEKVKKAGKRLRLEKTDSSDAKNASKKMYESVFEGEIIVPIKENEDFVKKLGVKTAGPCIRLLPWKYLLTNFYKKLINIWCPINSKGTNMILNLASAKPPAGGYVEMRDSKKKNGIVNWILSGKLPKDTPSNLVHLILSPINDYFEISGICLKNLTDEQKEKGCLTEVKTGVRSPKDKVGSSLPVDKIGSSPPIDKSSKGHRFTHKDRNNESNDLAMVWRSYPVQSMHQVLVSLKATEQSQPIGARLPFSVSLRFRMLFLNSNFTFLLFKKSNYTIKYTDLMHVVRMAQEKTLTVHLHGKKLSAGYTQPNFGIYADPDYADVLFIGPYRMNEEHGLQTLRYLKQELVPTEYFEMVQGGSIPEDRRDKWLWSSSYFSHYFDALAKVKQMRANMAESERAKGDYAVLTPLAGTSAGTTVDEFSRRYCDTNGDFITSEDLETKPYVRWQECVILNDKRLREEDYNRYLLTNIEGFGYLGAVQHDDSKAIEVVWPISNKVLRFEDVSVAVSYLKRRFTNLLMPVPASFDFKIFVHDDVEVTKDLPKVDTRFLNGTHICGSFGILDSRMLTPELALTIGTTQEDVLSRLAKRARFLGSLEIHRLKEQEVALINKKKELMLKKQNHLKRYLELLQDLPEHERVKEYSELMQKLQAEDATRDEEIDNYAESTWPEGAACIEIEDSDHEEPSSKSSPLVELSTSPNKRKYQSNKVMKTILKPKAASKTEVPSSSMDTEVSSPVKNFKLVKTPTGKVVFMRDNSGVSLSKSLSGMKLKIRNNKVVNVKTQNGEDS